MLHTRVDDIWMPGKKNCPELDHIIEKLQLMKKQEDDQANSLSKDFAIISF